MSEVAFKISSALKDIIGRDLITDDFIAVFELVKNSFDANARNVQISFLNLNSDNPSIVIKDDGDGMDNEDIRGKWLFVAYSSRKKRNDYRDDIQSARIYAGSKGIGRFSCDRLGAKLKLVSRKRDTDTFNVLKVDWESFEKNAQEEFQTIKSQLISTKTYPQAFNSGTILEISELRGTPWTRDKLKKLRRNLERLINPNQSNDSANFSIELIAPDELLEDTEHLVKHPEEHFEVVNGPIKNFIFEELNLKTTRLTLHIDKDGRTVKSKLTDRGSQIYYLEERNPSPTLLHDINIELFFLNRSAKSTFTRRMGVQPTNYGSVFLYKNGFRIHPIGEPGDDPFGMDKRKAQGMYRYLGSRDLAGRIEINGVNNDFRETSSRSEGLIDSPSLQALERFFISHGLRRLENYVIDMQRYGRDLESVPELTDQNGAELRALAFDVVAKLTRSKDIIKLRFDPDVLNIVENNSTKSVGALLRNMKRISAQNNDDALQKEIQKAEKQINNLNKAREEAEKEAERERERAKAAEKEARDANEATEKAEEEARKAEAEKLVAEKVAKESADKAKQIDSQNLFLKSVMSQDLKHVVDLHHSISQDAIAIEQFTKHILVDLRNPNHTVNREQIAATLERVNIAAKKIISISRFATRANFNADAEELKTDMVEFIREYLMNIHGGFVLDPRRKRIEIEFEAPRDTKFVASFAPINLAIILDNLVSNSRKHKAKTILITVLEITQTDLRVSFTDDGKGVSKLNVPRLFEMGFTTTEGSGLGLNHTEETIEKMNGSITFNKDYKDGAEFILTFVR